MGYTYHVPTGRNPFCNEVTEWKSSEVFELIESNRVMKILVATEKPFAPKAVAGIREVFAEAGYEVVMLEKYSDKSELLAAVADVDGLIIRSDKVTAEVLAAAPNLKIIVRAGAGAASTVVMMIVPILVFVISQSRILETMATSGMKD
mgnify:CR=1 FL=1